jgi:hypothetical protein
MAAHGSQALHAPKHAAPGYAATPHHTTPNRYTAVHVPTLRMATDATAHANAASSSDKPLSDALMAAQPKKNHQLTSTACSLPC